MAEEGVLSRVHSAAVSSRGTDRSAGPGAGPGAAALLRWYDVHRRDMPWRRTREPYLVWVSEVMLQQTRVETVLPYYERFVERFPDVEALAAAPVDEVLAAWSGLGYYRRARQMHAAARQVAEEGRFPRTRDGLERLPGIGPYTAAAVASICFGEAVPVMDGNVERVAARLRALDADPKAAAPRRELLAAAAGLLDPARPGDSNQALMELGASVCTPRRPRCLLCPLREPTGAGTEDHAGCLAAAGGDPERYPPPRGRRAPVAERRLVAVVTRTEPSAVLLFRRPEDEELMPGIWELPWTALRAGVDGGLDGGRDGGLDGTERGEPARSPGTASPAGSLRARYGVGFRIGERCGEVRHGITHRTLTLDVHLAELVTADADGDDAGGASDLAEATGGREARWVLLDALDRLPVSSMVGKALAAALPRGEEAAGRGVRPRRPARGRRRRA